MINNLDELDREILNLFNRFHIDNYALVAATGSQDGKHLLSTFENSDNPAFLLDMVSSYLQRLFIKYNIPAEDLTFLIDSIRKKQSGNNDIEGDDVRKTIKPTAVKTKSGQELIWDEEILIGYTKVNDLTKLSVSLVSKDEKMYVSICKLYRTKTNLNYKVAKGFVIPLEKAEKISSLLRKAAFEGGEMLIERQME